MQFTLGDELSMTFEQDLQYRDRLRTQAKLVLIAKQYAAHGVQRELAEPINRLMWVSVRHVRQFVPGACNFVITDVYITFRRSFGDVRSP